MSLDSLIAEFLQAKKFTEQNSLFYKRTFNKFISYLSENNYLQNIFEQDLNEVCTGFVKSLERSGYKQRSIYYCLLHLRTFFSYLSLKDGVKKEEVNKISNLVLKTGKGINPYGREKIWISEETIRSLINFWKEYEGRFEKHKERNSIIIELLFAYGLTIHQVSRLEVSQIDLSKNSILLSDSPKAKTRNVILENNFGKALESFMERTNAKKYIFQSEYGNTTQPLSERTIQRFIKKTQEELGLKEIIQPRDGKYMYAIRLATTTKASKNIGEKSGYSDGSLGRIMKVREEPTFLYSEDFISVKSASCIIYGNSSDSNMNKLLRILREMKSDKAFKFRTKWFIDKQLVEELRKGNDAKI